MVNIIQLPPEDPPKQLTARKPCDSLHEHFLAFLNANNPGGFTAEDVATIESDTIGSLLLLVSQEEWVKEDRFKYYAKIIKRQSNGAIAHTKALELLSRLFGYNSWYEVKQYRINTFGEIRNKRDRSRISLKIFS